MLIKVENSKTTCTIKQLKIYGTSYNEFAHLVHIRWFYLKICADNKVFLSSQCNVQLYVGNVISGFYPFQVLANGDD